MPRDFPQITPNLLSSRAPQKSGGPSSMSAKNRPYEQFGSFILFKKLETDALGDLWRAGRVDNGQLGPTMAVRPLPRGQRAPPTAAPRQAPKPLPPPAGATVPKDQTNHTSDGNPLA